MSKGFWTAEVHARDVKPYDYVFGLVVGDPSGHARLVIRPPEALPGNRRRLFLDPQIEDAEPIVCEVADDQDVSVPW